MPRTIRGVWNLSGGCGRWWAGPLCIEHGGAGRLSCFPIRSSLCNTIGAERSRDPPPPILTPDLPSYRTPPPPPLESLPDSTTSQAAENKPCELQLLWEKGWRPNLLQALHSPHWTVNWQHAVQCVLCCVFQIHWLTATAATELHRLSASVCIIMVVY